MVKSIWEYVKTHSWPYSAAIFGILTQSAQQVPEEVHTLAQQRVQARKNRDWAQSDALRAQIAQLGWLVEDTPQGQKLRRA